MESEYIELLEKFKKLDREYKNQEYVAFHSMQGNEYNNEIMFVGRALNGWKWSFNLADCKKRDSTDFYLKIQKNGIEDNIQNQLNWVKDQWKTDTKYKTSRSAFWRTIRNIVIGANIGNEINWNQKIVWSNLFKISNTAGNPSHSLKKFTRYENQKLLEKEISVYDPKIIIFLTGVNWFKEIFETSHSKGKNNKRYIEISGHLNIEDKEYRFVVTPHPQGKKEQVLANEVIEEVADAI